jgi:hypothetical protein
MSERGRSILPGVALAAAGLVLGIVFHEPLAAWFAPLFAGEPGVESVGGETTARPPEAAVMGHEAHQGHASPGHSDDGAISHYTCPMHPSVRQPGPGSCPLCGMDLTPVMVRDLASGTIVLDAERRQLIGVTTEAASRRVLRREVRAFGRVVEDETRLADVKLRMSGWIGDLRANQTGATVTKGETSSSISRSSRGSGKAVRRRSPNWPAPPAGAWPCSAWMNRRSSPSNGEGKPGRRCRSSRPPRGSCSRRTSSKAHASRPARRCCASPT